MVPTTKNRKKRADGDFFMTPRWVWEPWHRVLNFVLDAAATPTNAIPAAKKFYTKADDAFKQDWARDAIELGGSVWVNPPYSRAGGPLSKWVMKGLVSAADGAVVCMLLPADTSTNWFSLIWDRTRGMWRPGITGHFTDTRIKFVDPKTGKPTPGSPNFGSLIVVMSSEVSTWLELEEPV